jgi:site-specific recombinase XerD
MRYLHVCGRVSSHLAEAIPPIAGCRLSHIPRALRPDEMRRLLKSCDRRTGIGRRNFAVMILMTRLGLRRAEVAALRLDDIRWSSGELLVRGKANREDRLPLPQDVGDAIVAYIKRGRPRTPSRQVFLQHRAPRKALSPADVTGIVQRAGRRIGLQVAPHRLRHTAATQMLRAGASLSEIAHLLRHRNLDTTAIYVKVDDGRLRALARRWPGVQP